MLKFIGAGERGSLHQEPNFKTSHVKVYQTARDSGDDRNEISKHPMLKFIISTSSALLKLISISKHPMLKFIISAYIACRCHRDISKHPMLKFIRDEIYRVLQVLCDFKTSHVKVYPTHFLHSIQYTIPDSPVFINVFKIFTSHRAICQKNSQNHRNATVFADSRNFALIGGW